MTLRELRLWHWRKVLSFRATALANEAIGTRHYLAKARAAHSRANWHLGAVQALNDVVTTHFGDTAEADDLKERKQ